MKRFLYTLCLTIVSSWGLLSCLGDSATTEYTIYDETAITHMEILSINRKIHTTSKSGGDSVYTKTLTRPSKLLPGFTIDHENKTIYNTDSLPYDTDLSRVLISLSVSTYTGGVYVKGTSSDELYYYTSTDSIDFTTPREIRAYNSDLTKYRAYQVTINKHQVEAGSIFWETMPAGSFPVDEKKDRWEQATATAGLKAFIGYGTKEGYAYDNEGNIMVSTDEGATWTPDNLGDDPSLLPTNTFSFTSYPQVTNEETDYQLLVGTIGDNDSICTVWRKIAEYAERRLPSQWVYVPVEYFNKYALPVLTDLHVVDLHGVVLAISASETIYCSRDGGITWKENEKFKFPEGYSYPGDIDVFVDENDYLWLKDNDQDIIWRGVLVDD